MLLPPGCQLSHMAQLATGIAACNQSASDTFGNLNDIGISVASEVRWCHAGWAGLAAFVSHAKTFGKKYLAIQIILVANCIHRIINNARQWA